jgi:hypothetical protein
VSSLRTSALATSGIVLALAGIGCAVPSEIEDGPVGSTTATLRPNAFVVRTEPESIDEQSLTFVDGRTALAARGPGDVIVGGGREAYLRRIVGVERRADRIVFATEPAALVDVFEHAQVKVAVDGDEIADEGLSTKGYRSPQGAQFFLKLGETKVFGDPSMRVETTIGEFQYRPRLEFDLDIAGASLRSMRFAFRGDLYTKLAAKLTVAGPAKVSSKILPLGRTPQFTFLVPIGPVTVPIVVDMEFYLKAGAEAASGASVSVHQVVTATSTATVGFSCAAGRCGPLSTGAFAFTPSPATLAANGSAKGDVGIAGKINVRAAGVIGPYFTITPYVGLSATRQSSVTQASVRVGVDAKAGGELRILDRFAVGFEGTLFDASRPIASRASGAPKACTTVRTSAGSMRCNHGGLVRQYEAIEACVAAGGGGACFTSTSRYPYVLCGPSSGGGYLCDVDAMHVCLCSDGGLQCFHKHCR